MSDHICVRGGSEYSRFNKSEHWLSTGGGERGNKRPIEGHSRSCRPAQVKVTGGTGKRRILKTEEGTPAEDEKIGHMSFF